MHSVRWITASAKMERAQSVNLTREDAFGNGSDADRFLSIDKSRVTRAMWPKPSRQLRASIDRNRIVGRHEATRDIVVDGHAIALAGIADAGTTRGHYH